MKPWDPSSGQARAWLGRLDDPAFEIARDPCEWDPKLTAPVASAKAAHARADLIVGANGRWRLCRSCAALPYFSRLRKRVEIER